MTGILPLAVMLLLDPNEAVDAAAAAAISADADRVELADGSKRGEVERARITSRTSDFDRRAGVVMFEGDVKVCYSEDYTMCADRLYMFLSKSNEMNRVVAVGNVSISNETRTGTCSMARYLRKRGEIEMFADGEDRLARLVESGENASSLEGSRIKFWLDSEQVEIENSRITSKQAEGRGAL